MKKIQFTINNSILNIDLVEEKNKIKNLNNTNILNDEDLIFDMKYFKNNMSLVAGFLNVILRNDHIKNCILKDIELLEEALELLNYMPNIENLIIEPDKVLDYGDYLSLLKNDTLKTINCFNIPPYLLEQIDSTKSYKIETRSEVFFISNFIRINNLNNYADVYYKRKLIVDKEFNDVDKQDFLSFLSINKYLKTIYFETLTMDVMKKIIDILEEYNRDNILISIRGENKNLEYFEKLESYIKKNKFIKKNKIKFSIDYTTDYKLDNFLSLINFTTIKYVIAIVFISSILGYGINRYDMYKSSSAIGDISTEIDDLLEDYENIEETTPPLIESTESTEIPIEPAQPQPPKKPTYISPYYKNYDKVISILKKTNPDTVGWLTVPNTTVNYPVVQTTNNSYYLVHDFNKHSNSLGWVFMDYRNNPNELDQNTVIYGHNVARARLMFGNLSKTLNSSWYLNENNHYITFNTSNKDMRWKIFSIYKIPLTNDYLSINFSTQEKFIEFANNLKARSIYDFNTPIKENDKIITLSTCQNNGKYRLVVHAVLT